MITVVTVVTYVDYRGNPHSSLSHSSESSSDILALSQVLDILGAV